MRKDSWWSLKRKPRFKSQIFKFSGILFYLFAISVTVQKNQPVEKNAGVDHLRWYFRFRWVISYLICLPVTHKCLASRPGWRNMKESPAGVRGTRVLCCLFFQILSYFSLLFQTLQKRYWKWAQHSARQQPNTCPTWGEVQQYFAWGKASHRDYNLFRVDLWYLGMDHVLPLILNSGSVD